jgi:prolyl-tRNA synthetase
VIIPLLRDEDTKAAVLEKVETLKLALKSASFDGEPIRVEVDLRDDTPANKRWGWIKKGVPIICELGPRDLSNNSIAFFRRDRLEPKASFIDIPDNDTFVENIKGLLGEIHQQLYDDAKAYRDAKINRNLKTPEDLKAFFVSEGNGFAIGKWSGDASTEAFLKTMGGTIRCLPYEQSGTTGKCLISGADAITDAIYAKAY